MKQRYTFKVFFGIRDTYPNNFKCWVRITDHALLENHPNRSFRRRGYGKFIGNYSPIWITINKERKQLTEWERVLC